MDIDIKEQINKTNIDKELNAIIFFLTNLNHDLKKIYSYIYEMAHLRKQYNIIKKQKNKKLLEYNLQQQIKVWDKFLSYFESFSEDAEINFKRSKIIASLLKKLCSSLDLNDDIKNILNNKWD